MRIMDMGESRTRTSIAIVERVSPFMARIPPWKESGRAIANQRSD